MPARPVGDYAEMAVPSRGGNKESPPLKPGQRSPGGSPRSGRGRPARSPGRQVPGGARGVRKGGGGRRGGRSELSRGFREAAAAGRLRDALGRGPLGLLRVCGERLRVFVDDRRAFVVKADSKIWLTFILGPDLINRGYCCWSYCCYGMLFFCFKTELPFKCHNKVVRFSRTFFYNTCALIF